jgi:Exostosin family
MQALLNSLDIHLRYFTISFVDRGLDWLHLTIPEGLDLLHFAAGGYGNSTPNAVPIPLLKKEFKPSGLPKLINLSYQGTMSHPIRYELAEVLKPLALVLPYWESHWDVLLDRSVFVACPRGNGHTSFRLFEALQLHTIPIYVWHDVAWLPYTELVDWNEFAIVIESKDMHKLPELIASADVRKMQQRLSEVAHMFTTEYTVQYILDRINSDRCQHCSSSCINSSALAGSQQHSDSATDS